MRDSTKRARNFIILSLMFLLTAWFAVPRSFRRLIQPTAFAAGTTFTVNVTGDGQDANPGNGICATAAGNCSLRAAIQEANANAGIDTINFNIPGAGVHTISPASALPAITDPVTIDGYSQPGASMNTLANGDNAVLLIELNGASTGISVGLQINVGNSTVQGLVINRFASDGVYIVAGNGGGNTIQGCFIGTSPDGEQALRNLRNGVFFFSGKNNVIGGTSPAARNVISGNASAGVAFDSNSPGSSNQVLGNFIGTDKNG